MNSRAYKVIKQGFFNPLPPRLYLPPAPVDEEGTCFHPVFPERLHCWPVTCQKTWSGTENKVHIDHNKRKEMHGVIIDRLQKTHGLSD